MPPPKVIVKIPLDKQVVNNNYADVQWTTDQDARLAEIINTLPISQSEVDGVKKFKIDSSKINVVELSTFFKVPVDFFLRQFIRIYNQIQLAGPIGGNYEDGVGKSDDETQIYQEDNHNEMVNGDGGGIDSTHTVRPQHSIRTLRHKEHVPDAEQRVLELNPVSNPLYTKNDNNDNDLADNHNVSEVAENKEKNGGAIQTAVNNNGDYSYYIDNGNYSTQYTDDEDEDEDEEEDEDTARSSQFFLHRSKILRAPDFPTSRIDDFFNDDDEEEENGHDVDKYEEVAVEGNKGFQPSFTVQGDEQSEKGSSKQARKKSEDHQFARPLKTTNNNNNGNTNNLTSLAVNNEGVNGIITTKRLERKNSGASDLSNRSELEKALLDRL